MNTTNIQNMFDNGFDATVNFTVEQHLDLIEQIKNHDIMNQKWTEQQNINFARYFLNNSDTVSMAIWSIMCMDHFGNTSTMHQTIVDGLSVSAKLHDIIADKQRYANVNRELNLPY